MHFNALRGVPWANHDGPTNEDYCMSLGLYKEVLVTVNPIFKEVQEMLVDDGTMFVTDQKVFSNTTDDF